MGIEAMDTTMEMEEPQPAAKPVHSVVGGTHSVVGGTHGHPGAGGGIHGHSLGVHGAPDTPPMLGVKDR